MYRIFKIIFVMAVVVQVWKLYQQYATENRLRQEQERLNIKNKEIEQLRASCQFPDGYVKTGSGYWFNVKKFTDDVSKYRKDYALALDKNYYDALTYYLRFRQVDGQCQLQALSKVVFWNGHKLYEFEELVKDVDRHDKDIEVHINGLVKNTPDLSGVGISVCYTKECSVEPLKEPIKKYYTKCHQPVELALKYYKNVKIRFDDCDFNNGNIKNISSLNKEFIYTGISNFGYPYEFYCFGLLDDFEDKTVSVQDVLNTFDLTGKRRCQGSVIKTYPDDQLYFYGGRYSLSFNTSSLATLGELIEHTRAFATRYLSKEKPDKEKPEGIKPAMSISGDFK